MRIYQALVRAFVAVAFAFVMHVIPASAENTRSIVLLGTHFQNDNEMYEPTSDAERARLEKLGQAFTSQLVNSGLFEVMSVPKTMAARITAGQTLGECGGCELDYGAALGVDEIAWINVQKVSNLILNLNVYVADVKTRRMTFVRSVDVMKNYFLPGQG